MRDGADFCVLILGRRWSPLTLRCGEDAMTTTGRLQRQGKVRSTSNTVEMAANNKSLGKRETGKVWSVLNHHEGLPTNKMSWCASRYKYDVLCRATRKWPLCGCSRVWFPDLSRSGWYRSKCLHCYLFYIHDTNLIVTFCVKLYYCFITYTICLCTANIRKNIYIICTI
jgi:hypothetical protein